MKYVNETPTSESAEQIVDGIVDPRDGFKHSHIEHQIAEEATGEFEFRGGGTNVAVDTSVHTRYRESNTNNNNPAR